MPWTVPGFRWCLMREGEKEGTREGRREGGKEINRFIRWQEMHTHNFI